MIETKTFNTDLLGIELVDKQGEFETSMLVSVGKILGEKKELVGSSSNYTVYVGTSLPENDIGVVDLFLPSSSFSYFNGTILNFNGHVFNVSSYLPLSSSLYRSCTMSYFFYELYNTLFISYYANTVINTNIISSPSHIYDQGHSVVLPVLL